MPYNPANEARECLWCETLIEGRADKQFCSSSCKAHYNRENPKPPSVEPSQPIPSSRLSAEPFAMVHPLPILNEEDDEDEEEESMEDWTARLQVESPRQYDKHCEQEKTSKLHSRYISLMNEFLQEGIEYFVLSCLDDFIEDMNQAAGDYRQHPGLRIPAHQAHTRLADLYFMGDYLRGLRTAVAKAEAEATSFFGESEPEEFPPALSKKHRKRLLANLLGEE